MNAAELQSYHERAHLFSGVPGWLALHTPDAFERDPLTIHVACYERYGCTVISTLIMAEAPVGTKSVLHWHCSVRGSQGRPTKKELKRAVFIQALFHPGQYRLFPVLR